MTICILKRLTCGKAGKIMLKDKLAIQKIGLIPLTLLMAGAIDSIRNLPATALFGTQLIFFFILAAVLFLIPTALVSAELAAQHPQSGGIFIWVKSAFGERVGVLAIWLQWINTMIWYPTMLSFIAGTATYLIDPQLVNNKFYMISAILIVFWGLTLANLRGIKSSANIASFGALFGMIIPMILIIGLAVTWMLLKNPIEIHFTVKNILPNVHKTNSWISLTAIMTSFLGLELATVHVNHVNNAQKTFPRAMLLTVGIIAITMICGALAIAIIIPSHQLNLVDGIVQAFQRFLSAYHLAWSMPIIVVMILIGGFGGMINWLISPAMGLLQAAELGYLPKFLQYRNKYDVPSRILIAQAFVVSLACLAFLFMPNVNASYWLLTDLSTQLYMFMYVFMFCAAAFLVYRTALKPAAFHIPGGKLGTLITCLVGLVGCIITIIIGFKPPTQIDVGGFWHYEVTFTIGIVILVAPICLLYLYKMFAPKKALT